MKKLIKRNILNPKDKNLHSFNWGRVVVVLILLILSILVIMFIDGAIVDSELKK